MLNSLAEHEATAFSSFILYLLWFLSEEFQDSGLQTFSKYTPFFKEAKARSGLNPQNCLYFKNFQGSKLLNGCSLI